MFAEVPLLCKGGIPGEQPNDMKRILIVTTIIVLSLWPLYELRQLSAGNNGGAASCVNGYAAGYPCQGVDLLAHLPLDAIGGNLTATIPIHGNDHWGWHDEVNGRDYVLFGLRNGLSFIDITDRENPVYLGKLPARHRVN